LAETGREELRAHLQESEALYRADRAAKLAGVWLPDGVERKYPNAGCELGWFWVFPSHTLSTDPRAGIVRRHHLHESVIQKAVKAAAVKGEDSQANSDRRTPPISEARRAATAPVAASDHRRWLWRRHLRRRGENRPC